MRQKYGLKWNKQKKCAIFLTHLFLWDGAFANQGITTTLILVTTSFWIT